MGKAAALILLAAALALAAAPQLGDALAAVNGEKKKLPIYSVETDEKRVAISFDAAWGSDDTLELLGILRDYHINATFFLCGYWTEKYPDLVKRIYMEGNEIGNHGDHHAHGKQLSREENRKEIAGADDKIKAVLGKGADLFRPPYGEYNNAVIEAAESLNYYTIQWDVDSHDWMNKGVQYEVDRVLKNKNLQNGSIILFHNDAKYTPEALPIILNGLMEMGYEIVPVGELIHREGYEIDYAGRQKLKK